MAQAYPYLYQGTWTTKQDKCTTSMPLDKARIWLDFNELWAEDETGAPVYLFSQGDVVNDSSGADVLLYEGLEVAVFDDDLNEEDEPDPLLADGVVLRNPFERWPQVKWVLRLKRNPVPYRSGERYVYWMSDLRE